MIDSDVQSDAGPFRTWMGKDGIARSFVRPRAIIDIEDAIKNSKAVNALYQGVKFPLLVNITAIGSITKEARTYFTVNNRETKVVAFAIVVKSELGKIVANFFFRINQIAIPARMFSNEEKALKWLEQFKPK